MILTSPGSKEMTQQVFVAPACARSAVTDRG